MQDKPSYPQLKVNSRKQVCSSSNQETVERAFRLYSRQFHFLYIHSHCKISILSTKFHLLCVNFALEISTFISKFQLYSRFGNLKHLFNYSSCSCGPHPLPLNMNSRRQRACHSNGPRRKVSKYFVQSQIYHELQTSKMSK